MNNLPLISVIVPAYNSEKWIAQACHSVIDQTYKNWELIVVDDGSSDRTYEILKSIADEHIRIKVIHTENGGVSRARNIGLDACEGEYITFLDSDDLLLPDALETLYYAIEKQGADIVAAGRTNIDSAGRDIGSPYTEVVDIWEGTRALELSLKDHPSTYTAWGKLYKRGVVENVRFVEGKRVNEDSFFVFQCFLNQPTVALIPNIVLKYRLTENSASRASFSDKFLDILYFAEQKRSCICDRYPEYTPLADNVWVKANMSLLKNLCKTTDKKYRDLENKSIREIKKHKKSFVPAIKGEQTFFWIVLSGMYPLYKKLIRMKYYR